MTTSLAVPKKAPTYTAPGRYYIASPGTSRTILKNFTAPMTPRYYTGGAGGFRSYSPGQQATLRGAGQTAGIIGTSLARSASSAVFPGASVALSQSLGLATSAASPGIVAAYGFKDPFFAASTKTALGATLSKAMPYLAAATSFFTTQGSFGRKAANAAASGVAAYAMASPEPITKAIAVAIMGIQMAVGMSGGKGPRNLPLSGRSLPQNAPQLLKEFGGLEQGPSTLRRYRYFNQQFAQDTAPLNQAHSLVSTRLKSLSRIFPSMRAVSDELDRGRATALSGSGSPGEAYGKLQGYTNALTKAEIFIENLFADKPVQGYIKRKTNMPFEEFEKGFKFSTDVWLAGNVRIPRIETARKDALTEANRLRPNYLTGRLGYVDGSQYQTTIYQQQSPIQQATAGYTGLQGGYQSMPGGGYGIVTVPALRAGQYIGGSQAQSSSGRPAQYGSVMSTSEYNAKYGPLLSAAEAKTKATTDVTGPFDKQIKEYKDFMATTPQFGSYTHFRPFEPNWTPGMPQLGLPADAPGPDLDSLKTVLNVQDGQFAGMSGGSGYPLTRFGMGTVPRMSQGKMARQA